MSTIPKKETLKEFGSMLRQIREAKNLTQEKVYEDTHLHIARIELGNANITLTTLEKIRLYYNFSVDTALNQIQVKLSETIKA